MAHKLLDAGLVLTSGSFQGKGYFFKGTQYLRLDAATRQLDDGFPAPVTAWWPQLPGWDHVNAAVLFDTGPFQGKAYFFKGNEYLRYDLATATVDDGFPAPLAASWWAQLPPTFRKPSSRSGSWSRGTAAFRGNPGGCHDMRSACEVRIRTRPRWEQCTHSVVTACSGPAFMVAASSG
jgi:hypothetical protein